MERKGLNRPDTTHTGNNGFHGRRRIFRELYTLVSEEGGSVFLHGRARIGKTELLKRLYATLFRDQDRIIPFYYAFPEDLDLYTLCKDYLSEFIRQYIAFIRNDPIPSGGAIPLKRAERLIRDYPFPSSLIEDLYLHMEDNNPIGVARVAFTAPSLLSTLENARFCLLLDDFHNIFDHREACDAIFSQFEISRISCVLSGQLTSEVKAFIGKMGDRIRSLELSGFTPSEGREAISSILRRYDARIREEEVQTILKKLDYHPFYIKVLFDLIGMEGRGSTIDLKGFYTRYFKEISSGTLHLYFSSILESMDPGERKRALALLRRAMRGAIDSREGMDPSEREVKEYLVAKGLLRDTDHGLSLADPVVRDYLDLYFNRGAESPEELRARKVWEGLKGAEEEKEASHVEGILSLFRRCLERFSCQTVPGILFDYPAFKEDFGDRTPSLEEIHGQKLSLPKMVGVCQKGGFVIGYGFEGGLYREDKGVVWRVGYIPTPLVSEDDALRFLSEVEGLQEGGKEVVWVVGKDFSEGAIRALKGKGLFLSSPAQVELLLALLEDRDYKKKEPYLFEIILPALSEVELVAARAVEEIGRKASIDEESINKIKMALIEACINALEYGTKEGKVHIKVLLEDEEDGDGRVTIYVENEGGNVRPLYAMEPNLEEKFGSSYKRGWGFKLMRLLMDEVSFDRPSPSSTRLKLVKYIKR